MKFFIYNNGRSVYNINQIVRIQVREVEDVKTNKVMTKYWIKDSTDSIHDITKEEYVALMKFIERNND